jgi:hypothetical protein
MIPMDVSGVPVVPEICAIRRTSNDVDPEMPEEYYGNQRQRSEVESAVDRTEQAFTLISPVISRFTQSIDFPKLLPGS